MLKLVDLKEKNGITILALSVAIIILLILAGISISMMTGENGLIKNARKGKRASRNRWRKRNCGNFYNTSNG